MESLSVHLKNLQQTFFNGSIVDLQYCISFRYIAKQFSYIYFFRLYSIIGYYKKLNMVPCLYSKSFLFICFMYSSLYLFIPAAGFSYSAFDILSKLVSVAHLELLCKELCMRAQLNHIQLLATTWTVACQVPLSMEFSQQEYCGGLSFPSPGDISNPIQGWNPCLLHWQVGSLPLNHQGRLCR